MQDHATQPSFPGKWENDPRILEILPWTQIDSAKIGTFRSFAQGQRLTLPERLAAFQGGGIIELSSGLIPPEDAKVISERPIAVVPARSAFSLRNDTVIYYPTRVEDSKRHDANLATYQGFFPKYFTNWNSDEYGPLPLAKSSYVQRENNRYVTLASYRYGYKRLGKGGFDWGRHEMNTGLLAENPIRSLAEARRLVNIIDELHVSSGDFQDWVTRQNVLVPEESWLNTKFPKKVFRGKEWWIDVTAGDDRLRELGRKINEISDYYKTEATGIDVRAEMEKMIRENLPLYPHQNGEFDPEDKGKEGETVVVHGALNPDNIHVKVGYDGRNEYFITGGDRSHHGLRGEDIDWIVSANASSPAHQQAIIDEFMEIQKRKGRILDKEKKGLAMHVFYRSVFDAPLYAQKGMTKEADNLVQLACNILKGKEPSEWANLSKSAA